MLKIVVFDGGYGGELFADYLEETLPVVEVVRVIDWRNAEALTKRPKTARQIAESALRPYLGTADLIIFANHLLSITSLRYFRHKYPEQKFLGLSLIQPSCLSKRDILILTTKAVRKTFHYRYFVYSLHTKCKTLALDDWPAKIDDGELSHEEVNQTFETAAIWRSEPRDIILACSQFNDIRDHLYNYFSRNIKIYDSFDDTLRQICRVLKIRGGVGKKKS